MKKLIRSATVPSSLDVFCRGLLRELSEDYEVVALSSPGDELSVIACREGVRTIAVEMERHISPVNDLVSLCRLVRVLRRERPDIIHSMTPKAGLLCMIAAWIVRVPVRIHTFTGLVFPTSKGLKRRLLMLTDALTCACATHVVAEGQGVRNDLLRFGITRKNVRVLGFGNVRGIDLRNYDRTPKVMQRAAEIRREMGAEDDSFVFIAVGRLVGDKGIRELVEAFSRLLKEHPDVHLLLVGDEEPLLDPLPAATKGIITTNTNIHAVGNGSREIIINNQNGLIVPSHDADSLYAAMQRFADDTQLVGTLSSNARRLVAERYEQGFVRQCLKDFYKEIG